MRPSLHALLALLIAAAASGCASVQPARLELPAPLDSVAAERLQGLGGGRSGRFQLAGLQGDFFRQADQLALFDSLTRTQVQARADWRFDDGRRGSLSCRGAERRLSIGIIDVDTRPLSLVCTSAGGLGGELRLQARPEAAGSREARAGQWQRDGVSLVVRSLHRWQGAAWSDAKPAGHVVLDGERAIGALELSGSHPRVWLPAPGQPLREDVALVLTALALVWDPAR